MNLQHLNSVLSELSLNDLVFVYTTPTRTFHNTQNIRKDAAGIILLFN